MSSAGQDTEELQGLRPKDKQHFMPIMREVLQNGKKREAPFTPEGRRR